MTESIKNCPECNQPMQDCIDNSKSPLATEALRLENCFECGHEIETYPRIQLSGRMLELGETLATNGIDDLKEQGIMTHATILFYFRKHMRFDWGQVDNHDWTSNNKAALNHGRIISAYDVPHGEGETTKIWLITEADRSATTMLLPDEY